MPTGEIQGVLVANTLTKVIDGANGQEMIDQISLCNQNTSTVHFRLAIVNNGESIAAKHYEYYDEEIKAKKTQPLRNSPFKLRDNQAIWLYSDTANVSYQIDTL